ncbi:MAG: extracellular solute-binding protein [Hyphomicrobiaceae bacterium]
MKPTLTLATALLTLASFASGAASQSLEKLAITPQLVAAAEKEGEVTLQYSSPLVTMQGLIGEFTKAYPKIRVNLDRKAGASGANALMQEMAAGVARVDVFQGSDNAPNKALIDKGAFVAIEPSNVADLDKVALSLAPYLYFPDLNRTVIAYNPKFVTAEEAAKLKDWRGILDPVFKGRISLVEPTFGVTMAPLLYVMNTKHLGAEFLGKLKAQAPNIYVNTAQARQALISGQKPISWGAQWEAVILTQIGRGAPVRFVYPEPAVEWGGTAWGVLKTAPHPNAARLLLAWKLSREGGQAEQGAYSNMRSNITGLPDGRVVFGKVKAETWYAEPKGTWRPDLQDWIANGTRYQEIWAKSVR